MVHEAVEPPAPIRRTLYRCGSRFHHWECLEPLYRVSQLDTGLVFLSGDTARIITVSGATQYRVEARLDIPGGRSNRMKNGGQSAARFGRIRQSQIADYAKRVATAAIRAWVCEVSTLRIRAWCFICHGASEVRVQVMDEMRRQMAPLAERHASVNDVSTTDYETWAGSIEGWLQHTHVQALQQCSTTHENKEIDTLWTYLDQGDAEQRLVYGAVLHNATYAGMLERVWLHESLLSSSEAQPNDIDIIVVRAQSHAGGRLLREYQGQVGLLHRGLRSDWIDVHDGTESHDGNRSQENI